MAAMKGIAPDVFIAEQNYQKRAIYPSHAAIEDLFKSASDVLQVSQTQMANLLGVAWPTYFKWRHYTGKYTRPSPIFLARLLKLVLLNSYGVRLTFAQYIHWKHGEIHWRDGTVTPGLVASEWGSPAQRVEYAEDTAEAPEQWGTQEGRIKRPHYKRQEPGPEN